MTDNDGFFVRVYLNIFVIVVFYIVSAQLKIFNPFNLTDEKDYKPCTDINLTAATIMISVFYSNE